MIGQAASSIRSYHFVVVAATLIVINFSSLPVQAADPRLIPWECSNYTDNAQTRCLNAYIERQQEQIGNLESQLQSQQSMVGELKGQVDRQTAATAQLQQQLTQPPVAASVVPPPYLYPYGYGFAYPPVGIGLYLGRPWIGPGYYGFYGRGFWGPRFYYGHRGRHR
jgi:hypothetical protein